MWWLLAKEKIISSNFTASEEDIRKMDISFPQLAREVLNTLQCILVRFRVGWIQFIVLCFGEVETISLYLSHEVD